MKLKSYDPNVKSDHLLPLYYPASEYYDVRGEIFVCSLLQITGGRPTMLKRDGCLL